MASMTHAHDGYEPKTTGLEQDARDIHASEPATAGNIAIGVIIGRTAEFFDFFVFGIACVMVFPQLLFPFYNPLNGILASFLVFALAFIARPIGSLTFMLVDERFGRGVKLTVAMFLLGGSTAAMSFMPGYQQIGATAIVLICIFRFVQGMALGGAWDGLASLLALNAPADRRGWYAMIPQLGAPIGFFIASALFAYFSLNLSNQDFLDFGWRYPFFCAFAINVTALFARLRLIASPSFGLLYERHELQPAPLGEVFRQYGPQIVVASFVPLASFALFHLVTVFPLGWVTVFTEQSAGGYLVTECFGAALAILTIVASGVIADRVGRRVLLGGCAIAIAIFSLVAPLLLNGGHGGRLAFVLIGFALVGLCIGQASGALASRFHKRYRYSGSAFASDFSWLIGAGFAPFVALWLASKFGIYAIAVYLLSGAVCTFIALYYSRNLEEFKE